MLARARVREIYDNLHEDEITRFLAARVATFDVIASADTLCYFGDLHALLYTARRSLRPRGWIAFTVERDDAIETYRLQPHGRYCHARAYVEETLEVAGFEAVQIVPAVLRRELGTDRQGVGRSRAHPEPHRRQRIIFGHSSPARCPGIPHGDVTCAHSANPEHEQELTMSEAHAERAVPYLARILQQHLIDDPEGRSWTAEGSAVFADISGFTQLSEQLARRGGREGAEQITDTIGGSFAAILKVAYEKGASLLKFGGDAQLLWFQGDDHAARACTAAVRMRRELDQVGRIELPGAKVTLQMSQGVHTGLFHFFAVGTSHIEMLPTGPAWTRTVAMEHEANAGEILVSAETAALLPKDCLGEIQGIGRAASGRAARPRSVDAVHSRDPIRRRT